jgi:hypothetical protein
MGLGEAKRTGIYTTDAAHRPSSHMTLMGKVMHVNECPNESGSQIPGNPACKTGAVGAARRSRGFSMASMWHPCNNHVCGAVAISAGAKKTKVHRKTKNTGRNRNRKTFRGLSKMDKNRGKSE